jgi:hypothetical protein
MEMKMILKPSKPTICTWNKQNKNMYISFYEHLTFIWDLSQNLFQHICPWTKLQIWQLNLLYTQISGLKFKGLIFIVGQ